MTGRTLRAGRRGPGARAAGPVLVLALAVMTGCTAEESLPVAEEPADAAPVPNQVPDAVVAVTDPPRPEIVDVVLSFAGWDDATSAVEGAGYVSPVVESGGECALELERDGRTVVATAPAEADATTTICGGLSVPGGELAAGAWTAVLRYESSTTEGSSQPVTVEVPQ